MDGSFLALAQLVRDAVLVCDAGGVVVFANALAEQALAAAPGALAGLHVSDMLFGGIEVARAPAHGKPAAPSVITAMRRDGKSVTVSMSVVPLADQETRPGDLPGAIIAFRRVVADDEEGHRPTHGDAAAGEARLRAVLQSLSDGVAAISAEGQALFVNDAMARMLGFASVDELPQLSLAETMTRIEAFTEEGRPLAFSERPLVRALHGETVNDVPLRLRQPLRRRDVDVINTTIPVRDAQGAVTMAVVRMRDVSELRKTVGALQASQARYEMAMRAVDAMVYDWDLATGRVERSGGVEGVVGFRPDEVESTSDWWRARIHPDDQPNAGAQIRAELSERQERHVSEYRVRHRDGHWVHVADRGIVVYDAVGKAVRIVGSIVDVTQSRAAQSALRENEERYRSLIENANDIVATMDLTLCFTSVNAAVERVLGYAPSEIVGQPLSRFVAPDQIGAHRDLLSTKLSRDTAIRHEMQLVGRDGSTWFTLEVSSRLLTDEQGLPIAIHAIARDVTERKEAEARQAILLRELQHRTRNMLSVIQSIATQTLTGKAIPPAARDAFIGRLHALAHAQTFVAAGPRGGVPVPQLLTMALAAFGPRAVLVADDIVIEGAMAQTLALVVHELATNAVKHGSLSVPAGRVEVTCTLVGEAGERQLQLIWLKRNGPPVFAPTRAGFGTRLLQSMGQATLEFRAQGLRYRLAIDLPVH